VRTLTVLAVMAFALRAEAQQEKWDKDNGKLAPRLMAAGWVGTPVSLDALRKSDATPTPDSDGGTVSKKAEICGGNTVVLAFWTADIPC
jgi:hypothetical protein